MHFSVNGICTRSRFCSRMEMVRPGFPFIVPYFKSEFQAALVLQSACQPPQGLACQDGHS